MAESVLSIRDLTVTFNTPVGPLTAVRGVDVDVRAGEIVGVVGESGSGKSVTFLAAMGLLPKRAHVTGSVVLDGEGAFTFHDFSRSTIGAQPRASRR